jgi:putative flippase GtrA
MIAHGRKLANHFDKSVVFRFLVMGVINTLFGYAVFSLLIYLGLGYVIACLISTIAGILFNFQTLGKIVFKRSDNRLLFRFIGVYFFLYFFSITFIKIGTYFLQNLYIIGGIGTIFMAIMAYFLNKHLVFYRT